MRIFNRTGFTLLEILLVILIGVTIVLLTSVNLESYRKSSLVADASREIIAILETARSKTISGEGGYAYKVHFTATDYSLLDENGNLISRHIISNELEILSQPADITFSKVTGKSNAGTVTVRIKNNTPAKTITVSTFGIITEQ